MQQQSLAAAPPQVLSESAERGAERFEIEAEFVQLLADMTFVSFLGSDGYFLRPAFMRYLRHLLVVWSRPEYARHLRYPLGLTHLRLLVADEDFREAARTAAGGLRASQLAVWKAKADAVC